MKEPIRKIGFLVDKREIDLLQEACIYGADADEILEKAVKEGNKYRVEFLYEELDDLAGYLAVCANDEESKSRRYKWDKLFDKIEQLLKLSENAVMPQKYTIISPK